MFRFPRRAGLTQAKHAGQETRTTRGGTMTAAKVARVFFAVTKNTRRAFPRVALSGYTRRTRNFASRLRTIWTEKARPLARCGHTEQARAVPEKGRLVGCNRARHGAPPAHVPRDSKRTWDNALKRSGPRLDSVSKARTGTRCALRQFAMTPIQKQCKRATVVINPCTRRARSIPRGCTM